MAYELVDDAPPAAAPAAAPAGGAGRYEVVPDEQTAEGLARTVGTRGNLGLLNVAGMPIDLAQDVIDVPKAVTGLAAGISTSSESESPMGPTKSGFYHYIDPASGYEVTTKRPPPPGARPVILKHAGEQPEALRLADRQTLPGSSEWLKAQAAEHGGAGFITPPSEDTALNRTVGDLVEGGVTGLVGTPAAGGVRALAGAFAAGGAGNVAQNIVGRFTDNPSLQAAANIVAGAVGGHAAAPREATGPKLTARQKLGYDGGAGGEPPGAGPAPRTEPGPPTADELYAAEMPARFRDLTPPAKAAPPKPAQKALPLLPPEGGAPEAPKPAPAAAEAPKALPAPEKGSVEEHLAALREILKPQAELGEPVVKEVPVASGADATDFMTPDGKRFATRKQAEEAMTAKQQNDQLYANTSPLEDRPPGKGKVDLSGKMPISTLSAERTERTPEENARHTDQLHNQLKMSGLSFEPTEGVYTDRESGTTSREQSFAVHAPNDAARAQVEALAKVHGQQSVLHSDANGAHLKFLDTGATEQLPGKWRAADQNDVAEHDNLTRDRNGQHYVVAAPQEEAALGQTAKGASQRGGRKQEPPAIDESVARNLTPQERAQLRSDTAQRVVDVFHNLPPTEELAAAALGGQAKRGWYRDAAESIANVFGPDAPRFSALLASMSPQVSVETNFHNALRTFLNWDAAGRPQDAASIRRIMGESVIGSGTEKSVMEAWAHNGVRSLTHPNPDQMTISGPKVNSFMSNLHGKVNEVTLDSWMAAFARMAPAKLGGSMNAAGPGKSSTYLGYAGKVREASDMLTKLTGEKWTPAETQETIWSWAKTAYEHAGKTGKTIPELLRNKDITDELVRGTSDFHNLFAVPEHSAALRGSRFAGGLERLSAAPGQPAGEPGLASEARASAREALAPHLENAAQRLEAVRQSRRGGAPEAEPPASAAEAKAAIDGWLGTDENPVPAGRAPRSQRGGPKFTPRAPTPPKQLATPAEFKPPDREGTAGNPLAPAEQAKRADTLRAAGLNEVRASAVSGNYADTGIDFHTGSLRNVAGDRMRDVIAGEREGLRAFATKLIDNTGGTHGRSEGTVGYNRGQTMAAPVEAYNQHLEDLTKHHYDLANQQAKGQPFELGETNKVLGQKAQFLGLTEGKQLREGIMERMKELGLVGESDTFKPATVEQAESLRQYLNEQWTPRTGKIIGKLKSALDDDVAAIAGKNIYQDARAIRALRAAVLEEPEGVQALLGPSASGNKLKLNREIDFEKIPQHIAGLSVDQLRHLVDVYGATAKVSPQHAQLAANAIGEIRAHFANEVMTAGNSTKDMWNEAAVNRYLRQNEQKMNTVFKPSEMKQFQTLNDAGNILRMDRRYPGASAQAHNFLVSGALKMAEHGAAGVGAGIGHIPGAVIGMSVGKAAEHASDAILKRSVEKRITKL